MTALVGHRLVVGCSRRIRAVVSMTLIGVMLVAGAASTGGPTARADQLVAFDGAGDAPHISIIGDSTLSAVRWYADYGSLERFNFVLSAESCRRTIEQSCISREGYRSDNVIGAMRSLDGELGDVLVVMSGYNDPVWTIDEAIAGVVDEARRQEVGTVVWLSLRTDTDVDYSDPQEQSSIETFREYNDQLFEAAEASDGFLQVADWAAYSHGSSSWFEYDGVHLTTQGVDAVTTFIAGTVDRILDGEDVSPAAAPWTVLVPGTQGDTVADVQRALIAAGIDVAGGADGVFGYDTMAAVAEYQRAEGGLQVTGAVDISTARALGVRDDDPPTEAEVDASDPPPATTVPTDAVATPDEPVDLSHRGGTSPWIVASAVTLALLGVAVVVRRRIVVARRAARRRARVHPAASPHRSVADLRRSGELPAITARRDRAHGARTAPTEPVGDASLT